jgi:transposase
VHPVKGFVYQKQVLVEAASAPNGCRLEVYLRARRHSQGLCSACGQPGPTYDTQEPRRFDFVPLWGIAVVLGYALRRIACPGCGVKIERVPWLAPGSKSPRTLALTLFLARGARRLSWQEVRVAFWVSWESVYRAVEQVVAYGLEHRDLTEIRAIGVDEVAYAKGHHYATRTDQLDEGRRRLLHVSEGRTVKSLLRFFFLLKKAGQRTGRDLIGGIGFVCSDMGRPYLKVIAKKLPGAWHILDRYPIVANLNKALDQVRAEEARHLARQGWDVLKRSRWLRWRRRKRLTGKQRFKLRQVLQYDLKTVRAYLLEEGLQALWEYRSPTYAGRFLDAWCRQAMRSRLEPIKKVARSLRAHRESILNWFRAHKQYNAGMGEGFNGRVKLRFRKAFGFRTFRAIEGALYHELGDLPEPESTHTFC